MESIHDIVTDYDQLVDKIAGHVKAILEALGEDTSREGLKKTPVRAAKAFVYATKGYYQDAGEVASQAIFEYAGSRMIVVRDIEFYSLCEHHILPFFGKVSVGYIPDGSMIGLSKLARIVDVFARRLQVQERLTAEICGAVASTLGAKGVIVSCTAQHLCMKMRGVEKQDSTTVTLDYCGIFEHDKSLREEFLQAIR